MASRLRKFDKSILSQTTEFDDNQLLDTQDQIDLIDKLSTSNQETYKQYNRYLTIFYVSQICLVSFLQVMKRSKDVTYLLFILSILLNLISVNYSEYNQIVKIISLFVSLQLSCIGYFYQRDDQVLLFIVPWFNTITPYVFNYWFINMNDLVEELNKLKYEYKNV